MVPIIVWYHNFLFKFNIYIYIGKTLYLMIQISHMMIPIIV
jgi:hypothetical protein